jgi:polyferredoxin
MIIPVVLSLKGYGKSHCSHICPRGSFFGVVLNKISFQNKVPKWIAKKTTKNILLILMFSNFIVSAILSFPDPVLIGANLFRMMTISFAVGLLLGIIYKPRTWCTVCPMGHAAGMIAKSKNNKKAS